MLIRKAYDPQMRVVTDPGGPSRTKQAERDACDINQIMRRYEKTGVVTHVNRFGGDYADFSGVQDYQTSLNQVLAAREMFNSLPSKLRRRFSNDPAVFLDFVGDEGNREEMIELGLLRAPQEAQGEPQPAGDGTTPQPADGDPAPS